MVTFTHANILFLHLMWHVSNILKLILVIFIFIKQLIIVYTIHITFNIFIFIISAIIYSNY
jgi:hypothetical protein